LNAHTIRQAKCTQAQGRSSARARLLVRPRSHRRVSPSPRVPCSPVLCRSPLLCRAALLWNTEPHRRCRRDAHLRYACWPSSPAILLCRLAPPLTAHCLAASTPLSLVMCRVVLGRVLAALVLCLAVAPSCPVLPTRVASLLLMDKRRIPLRSASVRTPHLFHHGIPKVLVNPRSKGITSVRSTTTH
jgi:hypothetical protein